MKSFLKNSGLFLVLTTTYLSLVNCGKVNASSAKISNAQQTPAPTLIVSDADKDVGKFDEGYAYGKRNGGLIVTRLQDKTIGEQGCEKLPLLENALLKVTKSIHAPSRRDGDYVKGFFQGYLDSVRKGIQDSKSLCGNAEYDDGNFAGQLYGALLCQVSTIDIDIANTLTIESLYNGWSGGSTQVVEQCESSVSVALKSCSTKKNDLSEILTLQIKASCNDNVVNIVSSL